MNRTRGDDDEVLRTARAELSREMDALYALMQDPEIDAATERGFHASAEEMGAAALEYARRSGLNLA